MNVTTILERDQILDLCELIHTSHSGNLSGSRIPCPRVVPLYPNHCVDAQTQSHPGIAGRHPHSLPSHHLESGGGLHPLDRQGPPSLGARRGRSSTRTANTSSTAPLVPFWSWHDRPELYSGKHHTTGVNLQVACTLTGHLAWISPPLPGSVHDAKAIKESGFLTTLDSQSHIGDKEAYSQNPKDDSCDGVDCGLEC